MEMTHTRREKDGNKSAQEGVTRNEEDRERGDVPMPTVTALLLDEEWQATDWGRSQTEQVSKLKPYRFGTGSSGGGCLNRHMNASSGSWEQPIMKR